MSGVNWYNNLLKGVVNNNANVGIGMEVGAREHEHLQQHGHGPVAVRWLRFGGHRGGYMQNNYGCIITPSHPGTLTSPTRTARPGHLPGQHNAGTCPSGFASFSVSLGTVTNTSGTLTATATVTTVEYGMQGVVFAIDGNYTSAVMGAGPYTLNYGAQALSHRLP